MLDGVDAAEDRGTRGLEPHRMRRHHCAAGVDGVHHAPISAAVHGESWPRSALDVELDQVGALMELQICAAATISFGVSHDDAEARVEHRRWRRSTCRQSHVGPIDATRPAIANAERERAALPADRVDDRRAADLAQPRRARLTRERPVAFGRLEQSGAADPGSARCSARPPGEVRWQCASTMPGTMV